MYLCAESRLRFRKVLLGVPQPSQRVRLPGLRKVLPGASQTAQDEPCASSNMYVDSPIDDVVSLGLTRCYEVLRQGRGPNTHAFTHALESGHHMFMKLQDGKARTIFT